MSFLSSESEVRLDHARRIKSWARETFNLAPDEMVLVTEVVCSDPGCPPVETIISVLPRSGRPAKHKVGRPMMEVSRVDIERLALRSSATDVPSP